MRSIKLTIKGIPPSLNRFLGRANEWEYRHSKQDWTDMVVWAIRAQKIRLPKPFQKAHVTITYYFPDNRRHDADNYCGKFLMDGLTRGGIIVDDDFDHITVCVAGDIDRKNPRTEITVVEG